MFPWLPPIAMAHSCILLNISPVSTMRTGTLGRPSKRDILYAWSVFSLPVFHSRLSKRLLDLLPSIWLTCGLCSGYGVFNFTRVAYSITWITTNVSPCFHFEFSPLLINLPKTKLSSYFKLQSNCRVRLNQSAGSTSLNQVFLGVIVNIEIIEHINSSTLVGTDVVINEINNNSH